MFLTKQITLVVDAATATDKSAVEPVVVTVTLPSVDVMLCNVSDWSIFCHVEPLNNNQSPTFQSVIPFKLVLPAVATM